MANVEQVAITSVMMRRPSQNEATQIIENQAKTSGRQVVGIWREKGETIVRATVIPSENPQHTKLLAQSFTGADLLIIKSKT